METNNYYKSRVMLLLASLIGGTLAASPSIAAIAESSKPSELSVHQKLAAIREATSDTIATLKLPSGQFISKDVLLAQWYSAWNNWGNWSSWASWNSWNSYWGSGP